MSVNNFDELMAHKGHILEVVTYGYDGKTPMKNPSIPEGIVNVAIECIICGEVLLDFDNDGSNAKE